MTNEQRFKYNFRVFFEGIKDVYTPEYGISHDGWLIKPVINIPIYRFGITDIQVEFNESDIVCSLTLLFPGYFIGKSGTNLYSIEEHLSDVHNKPVKIKIIESKIWN